VAGAQTTAGARLIAKATVERRGSRYAMRLSTEHGSQHGERELEAADCAALMKTVTLTLSLMLGRDPHDAGAPEPAPDRPAVVERARPAPPAAPVPERVPAQPEPATPEPEDTTDAPPVANEEEPNGVGAPLTFAVLVGGGAQLALMPELAAALVAGVEVGAGVVSASLRLTAWPPVPGDRAADLRTRFDGVGAVLDGCVRWSLATLGLGVCGGARAGALRGRSSDGAEPGSKTAPWYALFGALSALHPLSPWLSLRLDAALAVSLFRPQFIVEGAGEVHRVPRLVPDINLLLVLTP
jgi:hypothetical protein